MTDFVTLSGVSSRGAVSSEPWSGGPFAGSGRNRVLKRQDLRYQRTPIRCFDWQAVPDSISRQGLADLPSLREREKPLQRQVEGSLVPVG